MTTSIRTARVRCSHCGHVWWAPDEYEQPACYECGADESMPGWRLEPVVRGGE